MIKEFVTYELAVKLKTLGFNEPCFGSWETEYVKVPTYTHSISEFYKNSNHPIGKVAASTFSQAFRFFREKYQASPSIHCMSEQGNSWRYHIPNEGGEMNFNTYEEAELACLNKLIEIVKQKQTTPYISDDFQIGPDGAFEYEDDLKDWDNTLMDGLEDDDSNLLQFAKNELQSVGLFDEDSDYGGMIGEDVIELIKIFNKQGHSGMSAHMVADLFHKLVKYEPLQPITGKDEEWGDVRGLGGGIPWYQNKRCSALFKDGENGKPYYIDAIVKKDQNGVCWSGFAWLSEEDYKSGDRSKMVGKRGYIKSFPFTPKTFYIDVRDVEVTKDDWESFIVDPSQLDEVWNYYDKD